MTKINDGGPDANGWYPIETAPKDGTKVLLCCMRASPEMKHMRGRIEVDFWHRSQKHGYEGWGNFNPHYYPATHWQPLPEPPVERSKSQGKEP